MFEVLWCVAGPLSSLVALGRVLGGGLHALREQDRQGDQGDRDGGQSEEEFHTVSVTPVRRALMTAVLKWCRAALQGPHNCP